MFAEEVLLVSFVFKIKVVVAEEIFPVSFFVIN
jgi:hypothetical protein